jgi:hypothetical protein
MKSPNSPLRRAESARKDRFGSEDDLRLANLISESVHNFVNKESNNALKRPFVNVSRCRDRVWHDYVWSQMDKPVREEADTSASHKRRFGSPVVNKCAADRCE